MELTKKQEDIIYYSKCNGLRKEGNKHYSYYVHTSVRRSGRMLVSISAINKLIKAGLIDKDFKHR